RCGSHLPALGDVRERRIRGRGGIDERLEAAQLLRIPERRRPLVLVAVAVPRHRPVDVVADAERVVEAPRPESVDAALELADPRRRALQAVGRADVVHEDAVDRPDQFVVAEALGEQVGVPWGEAAVAADVHVPAVLARDHADVLAAGFRALAGAPGDADLELVRRAQAAVAKLEPNRHPDRVLHAVPAPGGPDARLHGAQRLAVGLTRLEARGHEALPDQRELLEACPEHVDALRTRELRIEAEVARDLADDDEPLGGHLTAGHARHHRVGAVL